MKSTLYYIEPSVLHLSKDALGNNKEKMVTQFLDDFEYMLRTLNNGNYKFAIDGIIAKHLIDNSGEILIPLKLSQIQNENLRAQINRLQQTFLSVMNPLAVYLETNPCSIENDCINILPEDNCALLSQNYYCDFFHSILGECYRDTDQIIESILIMTRFTNIIGDRIQLKCQCKCNNINKFLNCISVDSLVDERYDAKLELMSMLKTVVPISPDEISVVQAAHAPVIGNTVISKYSDIPFKYRSVLNILLRFGMKKIEFRDWKSHTGQKGSLHNCSIIENTGDPVCDIIEGWLIIEDRSCKCKMYFPKNIPSLILKTIGDKINYCEVVSLAEELF